MSEVVLRQARISDAKAIAKVHVETWRSTYAGLVPDAYLVDMKERRQASIWRRILARESPPERTLVAEMPGAGLVGFGSSGPSRRDVPRGYGGEIYALYVAVDWQGQGFGRQLLTALLKSQVEAGNKAAFLWVLAGNPTRFFYEAMGGQSVAQRQEPFAGVLLDEIGYGWPDLKGWLTEQSGKGD